MNDEKKENEKIISFVLGNSQVGKTSFITKYDKNTFDGKYLTTVGVDFIKKEIKLPDGKEISLLLYDTAGQERYKSISYNLIKKADGLLLMYDITKQDSFDAINKWIENIKDEKGDNFPLVLVGNKCDLTEERVIQKEEGQKLAEDNGFSFIETSCKEGINIEESINILVLKIIEKKKLDRLKEIEEGEKNSNDESKRATFGLSKNKKQGKKKRNFC
jgi:small GTP-binding protein